MFRRRLAALGHHSPDAFNVSDPEECKSLVVWLEDQKIRHYSITDRAELRLTDDHERWEGAFKKYLEHLNCPFDWFPTNPSSAGLCTPDVLAWLLGHAVKLDYNEKGGGLCETGAASSKSNVLETLDYDSKEFQEGLAKLSELLNIPLCNDPKVRFEACCTLIKDRLNSAARQDPSRVLPPKGSEHFDLDQLDLGFPGDQPILGSSDPVLRKAAKILRLIHLKNLRDLQSEINNTIEIVQAATANPKTDTKLGKVGY